MPQRALLRSGEGEVQHHPAKGIESSGAVVLLDALRYGPQRFNGERSLPGGKRFKTAFIKPQDAGIFPQVHAQNVHFRLLIPGGTIIGGGQKPQCQKDGEKDAYRPPGQSLVHHNTSFAAGKPAFPPLIIPQNVRLGKMRTKGPSAPWRGRAPFHAPDEALSSIRFLRRRRPNHRPRFRFRPSSWLRPPQRRPRRLLPVPPARRGLRPQSSRPRSGA